MYVIGQYETECAECGSKDSETVTHAGSEFKRCRGCGHEGGKTAITSHTLKPVWFKRENRVVETF